MSGVKISKEKSRKYSDMGIKEKMFKSKLKWYDLAGCLTLWRTHSNADQVYSSFLWPFSNVSSAYYFFLFFLFSKISVTILYLVLIWGPHPTDIYNWFCTQGSFLNWAQEIHIMWCWDLKLGSITDKKIIYCIGSPVHSQSYFGRCILPEVFVHLYKCILENIELGFSTIHRGGSGRDTKEYNISKA